MHLNLEVGELLACLDALKFADKEGVLDIEYDYLIEKIERILEDRKI